MTPEGRPAAARGSRFSAPVRTRAMTSPPAVIRRDDPDFPPGFPEREAGEGRRPWRARDGAYRSRRKIARIISGFLPGDSPRASIAAFRTCRWSMGSLSAGALPGFARIGGPAPASPPGPGSADPTPKADQACRRQGHDQAGDVEPEGAQAQGYEQGRVFHHGMVDADG